MFHDCGVLSRIRPSSTVEPHGKLLSLQKSMVCSCFFPAHSVVSINDVILSIAGEFLILSDTRRPAYVTDSKQQA